MKAAPWPLWLLGAAVAGSAFAAMPAQAAADGAAGPPPAGRYAGELCVQTGDGAENCGPAELEFGAGLLRVQVSDIAYRLKLGGSRAEVVLVHGTMQIDVFPADYQWMPRGLRFTDAEKNVRYEVRWTGRKKR